MPQASRAIRNILWHKTVAVIHHVQADFVGGIGERDGTPGSIRMLCDVSHRPLPNPQQGGLSLHGQLAFIAIHLNAPVHPHEAFRHPVQRPLQGGFTERRRLQRRNLKEF